MKKLPLKSVVCALALTLFLAACGEKSKKEITDAAKSAATKFQLESILGKPDEMSKLGPVEKWTYKATDGTVVFVITGDTVALQAAN